MKRILSILIVSLIICSLFVTTITANEKSSRLVDDADLLTQSEENAILNKLDDISKKYEFDVVIVTQESIGKKTARDFADDYYDYNGYGFGEDYTGLLLLITFDDEGGIWHISTHGEAIDAFTDTDIDSIGSLMSDDMSEDNYYNAFNTFIDQCDYYINGYINGFPFDAGMSLVISLVIGFIIAFIAVSVMKGKLTSVAFQKNATTYVKEGSMNITTSRDFFLYSTITRTEKPKDNGSSTHTSSSGRTHGGGGGRF